MPAIIRRLPFFRDATSLRIPGGPAVSILPRQIVLWVSVTQPDVLHLPDDAPRFPAVLDTGFNDNFLIRDAHLRDWAGIDSQSLQSLDSLRIYGELLPVRAANVWLHPNVTGFRDQFRQADPFCLELFRGIAICPSHLNEPRLPLLGIRGLERNRLQVLIDAANLNVSIRSVS